MPKRNLFKINSELDIKISFFIFTTKIYFAKFSIMYLHKIFLPNLISRRDIFIGNKLIKKFICGILYPEYIIFLLSVAEI